MIAEQLKRSIIQAAIQGKLTEQLPEDGNATDLLKEIQKEKARLIKEGKIKKEKSLPAISEDEIPFDIPENWCWVRFGEIFSIGSARRVHQKDWRSSGVPFYRAREIAKLADQDFVDNDLFIEEKFFNKLKNDSGVPQIGDLMVTGVGTLGKTYVVKETDKFYYKDASVLCVTNYGKINPVYFKFFMESSFMMDQINSNSSGTTVATLTISRYENYLFSLPTIAEQNRIVEHINSVFLEIDKLKNDETKLDSLQKSFPKKMKDSVLQYAIQGKLTEQLPEDGIAKDLLKEIQKEKARLVRERKTKKEKPLPEILEEEIPFDIPENWCWVRLGEITDYGVGKQVNPNNIAPNSWILELEDIEKETFKLISKKTDRNPGSSKNQFNPGDVLYGKLRPYLKKVIIACESGYCSTEIVPFSGYGKINPGYLKYCMVSPIIDSYINSITHGMDMPRLGTDKAVRLLIPLPPFSEQERIVKRLDNIIPLCEKLE